ncbi:MAG: F0F1 ATP synthase subunit A [Methylocystaceae bacterium]
MFVSGLGVPLAESEKLFEFTIAGFPIKVASLIVTEWAVMALLIIFCLMATRNMQIVPRGAQNLFELVATWCYDFFGGVVQNRDIARKFSPLFATLFLFILISNYSGLIPGAGIAWRPYTGDWNVTVSLALIVWFATQTAAIIANGVGGYLKHFFTPHWAFFPLNLLEVFTKPLSLTIRLFGNIFGEETIISYLLIMAPFIIPMALMGLGVLTGFIQAMIFAILAANYVGEVTEVHEHH